MQSKHFVLYKHTINSKYVNFIEFKRDSVFVEGFYYGTEFQKDGTPIYYKAKLDSVKINGSKISFTLTKYSFGKRAMGNHDDYTPSFSDSGEIPFILRFNQYFLGTISDNKLALERISDIYNSRSDKMDFIR